MVGLPSVGKSTLLKKLTKAKVEIKSWPFTTLNVIPGMLKYKGAHIQIFDLPGIIKGAAGGRGKGKEVLSAAKIADLLILMVDVKTSNNINNLLKELKGVGLGKLPRLLVVNKIDLSKKNKPQEEGKIFISAQKELNLDQLKESIWQKLKLIRVYLKPKGKEADLENPFILREGGTVKEVWQKIFPQGKEIRQIFLWGPSARFPAQQVSLDHLLKDEDILSFN